MTQHFFQSTPQEMQDALNDVNRKMEEEETKARAASLNLPYINLHNFPVDLGVLGMFTVEEAKAAGAVPFYKDVKDLRIGVTDPSNPLLAEKVRELSEKHSVSNYLISKTSLVQAMRFYSKILHPKMASDDTVRIEKEENYLELLKLLQSEKKQQSMNMTDLAAVIFGAGIFYKASDIHIEPEDHFVKIRYRVDGVLQDMLHISKVLQKQLTARLKIISKLKLNVENVPQDGRITFYYLGKPIDVRVSSLPSAYGEEFVMRLLGTGAAKLNLKDLGFRPEALNILERLLQRPNGMIVTTGPTGSGKTTSLYAFLNQLNEPGVKIITLEDPVEYKLEGIVQTPIDHNHDFDFAKGLRAILRQDPDIVMVGEIRDQETAETACQAALTGHQVFSTLHTNDSSGAIPRLTNMGVKPFVLAPALSCVMAQRLVRKICQNCKTAVALSPHLLERINHILSAVPKSSGVRVPEKLQFYHSTGCEQCHNLGYKGRIGIYEVLEVTDAIQELIFKEASMSTFRKAAVEQGMLTMAQDGLLKALDGITDAEEVFRVAGE
jgi:type IV pilus assembly protein PilB